MLIAMNYIVRSWGNIRCSGLPQCVPIFTEISNALPASELKLDSIRGKQFSHQQFVNIGKINNVSIKMFFT